jgi:hypothetical protein
VSVVSHLHHLTSEKTGRSNEKANGVWNDALRRTYSWRECTVGRHRWVSGRCFWFDVADELDRPAGDGHWMSPEFERHDGNRGQRYFDGRWFGGGKFLHRIEFERAVHSYECTNGGRRFVSHP